MNLETEFLDDFVHTNICTNRVLVTRDEDFINLLKGKKMGEDEE